jgi:hypothetical protein
LDPIGPLREIGAGFFVTGGAAMPTNPAINDRLIREAQKLGKHRTKNDTVTAALQEYIPHRKQANIVASFGTIDYDPSYDYKRERDRKCK